MAMGVSWDGPFKEFSLWPNMAIILGLVPTPGVRRPEFSFYSAFLLALNKLHKAPRAPVSAFPRSEYAAESLEMPTS